MTSHMTNTVDVVIPAYNEAPQRVGATVKACLNQTYPVQNILVVDDGSSPPLKLPEEIRSIEVVHLIRLPENCGQPAARNEGLSKSNAEYVACVDVEVLPAPDWVKTCLTYLNTHPDVGACCSRVKNDDEKRLFTQWRMRFLENPYERTKGSRQIDACIGHAVFFRQEAIEKVNGYDSRYAGFYEDADICFRMQKEGYESHVVADTHVNYLDDDTLPLLAKKVLRASGWALKSNYANNPALRPINFAHLVANQTYWLFHRIGRNLFKLRLSFIPVDIAVWVHALRIGWQARREFQ